MHTSVRNHCIIVLTISKQIVSIHTVFDLINAQCSNVFNITGKCSKTPVYQVHTNEGSAECLKKEVFFPFLYVSGKFVIKNRMFCTKILNI